MASWQNFILFMLSMAVVSSCQVTERVLKQNKELSTIEVTDTVGTLYPTPLTTASDGFIEIKGIVAKPYRYKNNEYVEKVIRVKGNNRYKLGAMMLGAAGITAGLTMISQEASQNNPFPIYLLAGSALTFGAGLGGLYIDTTHYHRLSSDYYYSADSIPARLTAFALQLNNGSKVQTRFDSSGVFRTNVFEMFNVYPSYNHLPFDTLKFHYGATVTNVPVRFYTKHVLLTTQDVAVYSQPNASDVPIHVVEPGIFFIEGAFQNENFAEVLISGSSYFVEKKHLTPVYTNEYHYSINLPDINQFVATYLKNSALKYLRRLEVETEDQYKVRLQRFDAQKNSWLRQALDAYAQWMRDRFLFAKIKLIEYDADNQLYLIEVEGFGHFPVRVSRSMVTSFKEEAGKIAFGSIKLNYRRDALEVEEISILNTVLQTQFSYEERMRRMNRGSKLWDKTLINIPQLRREIIAEFFAKTMYDFYSNEDEFHLPVGKAPYSNVKAVFIENTQYKYLPTTGTVLSNVSVLRQLAIQSLGITPENIISESNTTKADIQRIFGKPQRWIGQLPKVNTASDAFLLFYINGIAYIDSAQPRLYLLPVDGHPSYISLTGVALDELIQSAQALGYKKMVFLLDVSFLAGNDTSIPNLVKNAHDNVAVIFTTTPGQTAHIHPRTLLSLFLHRFVKELSAIDSNEISIGQIYDRLCCGERSVNSIAQEYYKAFQNPLLQGNRDLIIFKSIHESQN
ncbi:hypothetical protein JCM31826_21980 [Thermaurantimonas aggregans]|uniref:Uncharacterized protein n=1 Tax=Thermaurantimonas aggregans TaxID=2173829 RepID=A0A401XNW8_9FLAO|nr:caspase family protein [Thermaurantimonas aggregans]MCX8149835.1 caspase family protein [Thermaurantimonas aggregans]GCD78716.1 hypothetical protein JCM31826_21980 [Thermaurantimonas aggregans]